MNDVRDVELFSCKSNIQHKNLLNRYISADFTLLFPWPSSIRFAAWFSYANAKCAVGQCTNF